MTEFDIVDFLNLKQNLINNKNTVHLDKCFLVLLAKSSTMFILDKKWMSNQSFNDHFDDDQ
ncbi:hypothetical protein DERP_001925 [Dermatophagoides pteronyssinus]|uniref:Uncharacterized protein n=1 Tax=Dermatophagoides pteronyssinus TaxID=6956 RepID=A0ABQ8JCA8_DERPT|nr:hypothetical protein DERP_001925 [Dermatophagoides pteronyssinus]